MHFDVPILENIGELQVEVRDLVNLSHQPQTGATA